jgi:hypothetical protein
MTLTMKSARYGAYCALAWWVSVPLAHGADENFCINYQGVTGEAVALGVRDWSGGSLVAERVTASGTEWPPAPVSLGARKWEPILLQASRGTDVQSLAAGLRATTAHTGSFPAPGGYLELVSVGSTGTVLHSTRFTSPVVVAVTVPTLPDRAPKFEFEVMPDQQLAQLLGTAKCVKAVSATHAAVAGDALRLSAEGLEPITALRMVGFKYGVNLVGESGGLRSGQLRISPKGRTETVKFTLTSAHTSAWFQWFQEVVVQFKDMRKTITVTLLDSAGHPALNVVLRDVLPLRWSPMVSESDPVERYVLEVAPTQVEITVPQ